MPNWSKTGDCGAHLEEIDILALIRIWCAIMCAGGTKVAAELLNEKQVSSDYTLTIPWLRRARLERRGPAFLRIGKRLIRYRRSDIEAFLERRLVRTDEHDHNEEPGRAPGA